jgi:hypothetical protein
VHVQVSRGLRPEVPASMPGALQALLADMWHEQPAKRPNIATVSQ